jgi:IclR family transcriptional regulator, KDG regulon repressor
MPEYRIQSIDRAFQILNILAESSKPLSLDEVAVKSNLNRNTAFKLLASLSNWNVVHSERHKGYSLGYGFVRYYEALSLKFPWVNMARNYLSQLRDITGESTGLYIQNNLERQCIEAKESNQVVRRMLKAGEVGPIYLGAIGKIFLAYKSPKEREELLPEGAEIVHASGKRISKEELHKVLDQVKKSGTAMSIEEGLEDVWAVASPILDKDGEIIAGIATTGPMNRFNENHMDHCSKETKRIAEVISQIIHEA